VTRKNQAAVQLGRLGGKGRVKNQTPEERRESANGQPMLAGPSRKQNSASPFPISPNAPKSLRGAPSAVSPRSRKREFSPHLQGRVLSLRGSPANHSNPFRRFPACRSCCSRPRQTALGGSDPNGAREAGRYGNISCRLRSSPSRSRAARLIDRACRHRPSGEVVLPSRP
jgi:hypothetical protein